MRDPQEFVRGVAEFIGVQSDSDLIERVAGEAINKDLGYLSLELRTRRGNQ